MKRAADADMVSNQHSLCHYEFLFSEKDTAAVKKAVAKKNTNVYYEARLLSSNYDKGQKPKKVYCYLSPKVGIP